MAKRELTKAQRQWVIDRDGGKCVLCGFDRNLHVHHIIGHRALSFAIGDRQVVEHPLNLVTVCKRCHISNNNDHMATLHPDISWALVHGADFSKVFKRRMEKLTRKVTDKPLWNHAHDGELISFALYNTLDYLATGKVWPE